MDPTDSANCSSVDRGPFAVGMKPIVASQLVLELNFCPGMQVDDREKSPPLPPTKPMSSMRKSMSPTLARVIVCGVAAVPGDCAGKSIQPGVGLAGWYGPRSSSIPDNAISGAGGDESDCIENDPRRAPPPTASILNSRRQRALGGSASGGAQVPDTLKLPALAPPIDSPEIVSAASPVLVTKTGWMKLATPEWIRPKETASRLKLARGPAKTFVTGEARATTIVAADRIAAALGRERLRISASLRYEQRPRRIRRSASVLRLLAHAAQIKPSNARCEGE